MKRSLTALIAATCLALPALAGDASFDFDISYDAAKLTTQSGAAEVYADIKQQVKTVCARETMTFGLIATKVQISCEATNLDKAIREIDTPRLTSIHEAENG